MSFANWIIRTLRIPGTWVTYTPCVHRALERASVRTGDRRRASSLDLLAAILDEERSGLRSLLVSLRQDATELQREVGQARQVAARPDRHCLRVVHDSYRVASAVPVRLAAADGTVVDRKQELHSCHLLWGFTRRRSGDAAAILRRLGISTEALSRLPDPWGSHCDAG